MTSATQNPEPGTRAAARLIVGMGATGASVARYLARQGLPFAATDSRAQPPGAESLRACSEVACRFGGFASPWPLDQIDEAVVSPGISLDEPFLLELRAAGVPLVGDIELFARAIQHPAGPGPRPVLIAITGSNGKSTVTALVAEMARAAGRSVAVGGNFGTPALDLLAADAGLYLIELSSFQLALTESLAPTAAVVLNVSADHIDRHKSLPEYAAIKARVYRRAQTALINRDDPQGAAMPTPAANRVSFGARGGDWRLAETGGETWLCRGSERWIAASAVAIRGRHNLTNALAALALGDAAGLERGPMLAALRNFPGLAHRCQFVATIRGVDWINDSKGTNVGALLAALEGLAGPIVLLAGGQAKGGDFAPVGPVLARKGRAAVLFGADAERIAQVLQDHVRVERAGALRAAVERAAGLALAGDTVLLSPGCASLDQFRDYRDRGEQFTAAVLELAA